MFTGSWARTVPKNPPRMLSIWTLKPSSSRAFWASEACCPMKLGTSTSFGPLEMMSVTDPPLVRLPEAGSCATTAPLGTFLSFTVSGETTAFSPAASRALTAAPCSWPRTSGTGMGCGPLETVRPTGVPCLTGFPLRGAWARTVPAGAFSSNVSVIGPRAISAPLRAVLASSRVFPVSSGSGNSCGPLETASETGWNFRMTSPAVGSEPTTRPGETSSSNTSLTVDWNPAVRSRSWASATVLLATGGIVPGEPGPMPKNQPATAASSAATTSRTIHSSPRRRGFPSCRVLVGVAAARWRAFSSSRSSLRWVRLLGAAATSPSSYPAGPRWAASSGADNGP